MFRRKNIMAVLWAILVLGILLTGCGDSRQQDTTQSSQTETQPTQPKQYTVRFLVGEQTLSMQMVQEGAFPDIPKVNLQGYLFHRWVDKTGKTVTAETPIYGDSAFAAVVYPDLTNHAPYLFTDENGYIRSEDILTGAELSAALNALAVKPAVLTKLTLPQAEEQLTGKMLRQVLEVCFPEEALQDVTIPDLVTRGMFAQIMNSILGRTGNVTLAKEQILPGDLEMHKKYGPAVLEAILEHTHDEKGLPIEQAVLKMPWQPGFTNLAGWLYYADETGKLLVNGELGTLTFGADGRYTCGDEELDETAAELVFSFIRENPDADREELLMKAFEYSRDAFTYVNRGLLEDGQTGWEVEKTKQMFEKKSGNCYNFAGVFWILARFLGYDATCYSGRCLSNAGPHGWVDIVMDGKTYIFDPQLAWREKTGGRTNWGEDMFKIPEYLWHQWRYIYPEGGQDET